MTKDFIISDHNKDFIISHRNDDIRQLALQAKRYPDIDMTFAIQQIDGWQRARHKLPMWAECVDIIYPPHISMEQCSSEQTALYKQQLAKRLININQNKNCDINENTSSAPMSKASASNNASFLYDLTGGFGVDFSYMSQVFDHATYIEQQQHLCDIAQHNFNVLGLNNTTIINANSTAALSCNLSTDALSCNALQDNTTTVIYLDPARRDTNGKKTYAISDCTPDVVTLLPLLKQKADIIIIKLSPMLDHHEALRLLPGITEVHIISVNNECKEILLVINQKHTISPNNPPLLYCVNNDDIFITPVQSGSAAPSPTISKQSSYSSLSIEEDGGVRGVLAGNTLYIPNASIMKAGCFSALCQRYSLQALDNNSHLFILAKNEFILVENEEKQAINTTESFPGRCFIITAVCTMNKKDLKSALSGITKANIAIRNFPLSADALRKKLSLKDGGDIYIFATTIAKTHLLLICKKTS